MVCPIVLADLSAALPTYGCVCPMPSGSAVADCDEGAQLLPGFVGLLAGLEASHIFPLEAIIWLESWQRESCCWV